MAFHNVSLGAIKLSRSQRETCQTAEQATHAPARQTLMSSVWGPLGPAATVNSNRTHLLYSYSIHMQWETCVLSTRPRSLVSLNLPKDSNFVRRYSTSSANVTTFSRDMPNYTYIARWQLDYTFLDVQELFSLSLQATTSMQNMDSTHIKSGLFQTSSITKRLVLFLFRFNCVARGTCFFFVFFFAIFLRIRPCATRVHRWLVANLKMHKRDGKLLTSVYSRPMQTLSMRSYFFTNTFSFSQEELGGGHAGHGDVWLPQS